MPEDATLLQVDDEPDQFGRPMTPAVAVGGGLRANLEALAGTLGLEFALGEIVDAADDVRLRCR